MLIPLYLSKRFDPCYRNERDSVTRLSQMKWAKKKHLSQLQILFTHMTVHFLFTLLLKLEIIIYHIEGIIVCK